MSPAQWNRLSEDTKQNVLQAVFNSDYIAWTHRNKDTEDPVIKEALRVSTIYGDIISINIHKEVKIT